MPFASLPNELVHEVLVYSVLARGVKRGLRLRLVSRDFAEAALSALFDSGLLDDVAWAKDHVDGNESFWSRYIAHRALHEKNGRLMTKKLRTVKQVAERIVSFRRKNGGSAAGVAGDDGDEATEELKHVLERISRLPPTGVFFKSHFRLYFLPDPETPFDGKAVNEDEKFHRELLSAAAYLDEVELVRGLLERGFNHEDACAIFTPPITAASQGGSLGALALLMQRGLSSTHPSKVIFAAARANQLQALRLALDPPPPLPRTDPAGVSSALVGAAEVTTSSEMFGYLYGLLTAHGLLASQSSRIPDDVWLARWRQGRFVGAADVGAVGVMRRLLETELFTAVSGAEARPININGAQIDDPDNIYGFRRPISMAARGGHLAAVELLISLGANVGSALTAAVAGGSFAIAEALLAYRRPRPGSTAAAAPTTAVEVHGEEVLQDALWVAAEREDEAMLRLLGRHGAVWEEQTRAESIEEAEEAGLESVVRLLRGSEVGGG